MVPSLSSTSVRAIGEHLVPLLAKVANAVFNSSGVVEAEPRRLPG